MWIANIVLGVMMAVSAQAAEPLKVRFTGARSSDGYLAISVFSEQHAKAFPGDAALATQTFYLKMPENRLLEMEIEGLGAGRYAIAIMHDEDGDKKLRTNFLGIPLEGFGFSLNPKVFFGAPAFQRAAFDTKATQELEIKIKYF